jgi:hypothetical protein
MRLRFARRRLDWFARAFGIDDGDRDEQRYRHLFHHLCWRSAGCYG